MKYNTLDTFDLKNKSVLLRVDLNSEIAHGKVTLSDRIIEHAKTIKELQKKKARVTILAHQSRPGKKDFISLKQHAKLLNKYVKVKFIDDILGKKAITAITKCKPGEALLLENVRMLPEEFEPSTKTDLVRILSPLHDYFFNDAFSIAHRDQTSITQFAKVLPAGVGRVMEYELRSLDKVGKKSGLFILSGAKPEDNITLLKKANKVLAAGFLGQLALIKKGQNFGAQNTFLKEYIPQTKKLAPYLKKMQLPVDYAVKKNGKRVELTLDEFPSQSEIFDIGTQTQENFVIEIKKAKAIFMKGPVGYCEEKQFCKGTETIFKAIAKSKAFSVLAGGHTTTTLRKLGISKKKFDYVSLSGGALIQYLAGKKLPGLEVLKKR